MPDDSNSNSSSRSGGDGTASDGTAAAVVEIAARVLTLAGSAFCGLSIRQTFLHSRSELFEAPSYPKGPKHPRYHAYRGGTLALGAVAALNAYAWTDADERANGGGFAAAIAAVAAGYFGGWWPPRALGLAGAPNRIAERNHRIAAALCLSSLALTHPWAAGKALGGP